MNKKRKLWAEKALTVFAKETGLTKEDSETIVGDFLIDLRHYCHQKKIDFEYLLQKSERYFQEELEDEDEVPQSIQLLKKLKTKRLGKMTK